MCIVSFAKLSVLVLESCKIFQVVIEMFISTYYLFLLLFDHTLIHLLLIDKAADSTKCHSFNLQNVTWRFIIA